MWLGRLFLAAGYVYAGRLGDAEWEIDEILIANPGFSLEGLGNYVPYEHPADLARLSDALKTAGLT
jgi:hypothetical protein